MIEKDSVINNRKRIGKIIRDRRVKMGFTQSSLAKEIPTRTPNITRIERGEKGYNIDYLIIICNILDIDLSLTEK